MSPFGIGGDILVIIGFTALISRHGVDHDSFLFFAAGAWFCDVLNRLMAWNNKRRAMK